MGKQQKKFPAPKGAELKLESKSSLKAKQMKAFIENTIRKDPFMAGKNAKDAINRIQVKAAFDPARKGKKKKKK